MPSLQRANVAIDDFRGGDRLRRIGAELRHGESRHPGHQEDGSSCGKPAPRGYRRTTSASRGDLQLRTNLFAQPRRSRFIELRALKGRAQRLRRAKSGRALAASLEVALEFGGAHGVELAVEVSVQERRGEITAHGAPPAGQAA